VEHRYNLTNWLQQIRTFSDISRGECFDWDLDQRINVGRSVSLFGSGIVTIPSELDLDFIANSLELRRREVCPYERTKIYEPLRRRQAHWVRVVHSADKKWAET